MYILWKRKYDIQGHSYLKEMNLENMQIDSPTVILLSGISTRDGNKRCISGDAKQIERLIKATPSLSGKTKLYIWSYTGISLAFNVLTYRKKTVNRTSKDAKRFVRHLIAPLVAPHGKPLPFQDAARKLRNLTLIGYSAGAVFAQEIYNAASEMIGRAGYGQVTARRLLQEIVLISVGPVCEPAYETNRFTAITLAARNDRVIQCFAHKLHKKINRVTPPLAIQPLSQTALLAVADTPEKHWEWRNINSSLQKSSIHRHIPSWLFIRDRHELAHYITLDDEHSAFSKIAGSALGKAIERQGKKDVLSLLVPHPSMPDTDKRAYLERLSKSMDANDFSCICTTVPMETAKKTGSAISFQAGASGA